MTFASIFAIPFAFRMLASTGLTKKGFIISNVADHFLIVIGEIISGTDLFGGLLMVRRRILGTLILCRKEFFHGWETFHELEVFLF